VSQPLGPGWTAPAPHRSHTGLVIGIIAGALAWATVAAFAGLVLAHGSLGKGEAAGASAAPAPHATGAARDHGGDLRRFLVPEPDDAEPRLTSVTADGRLDVAEIAANYQKPSEAISYLMGLGFATGAVRSWIASDGKLVEVDLFRFGTSNGAYSYFRDTVNGDLRRPSSDYSIRLIRSIPGADGEVIEFSKTDQNHYQVSNGLAVRGDVVLSVWTYQSPPQSVQFTESITYDQWTRL
jgi:hypothetical protein